jgi:peptidyl-prolyl cis-trans isomerase D
MLTAMRGWLNSWVAKGLFVLLILSFAVWGIGDFVTGRGGAPNAVATVGGREVPLADATEAYRRQLAELQRSFGPQFQPVAPLRQRIAEDAVNRLVTLTAVAEEADARGIVVTDEALRQVVFSAQPFQGLDGRFSRIAFEAFLRNAGLTEARFLELLRGDVKRQQLLSAVRAGAVAPVALAAPVLAFQQEQREAIAVEMPFIAAAAPPEPTEDQLRRYWENNAERFTAPEYRRFALLALTVDDVARDITPTEAQLRAAYDVRAAEFQRAERRAIEQAVVADEAAARALADAWRAGLDFAALEARAAEAGGTAVALGEIAAAELPDAALAAAAFAAEAGAVLDPVRSPFGWHVMKVLSATPAATRSFDEVKAELAREVAHELAAERIYSIANRVEDSIAEGIPLAEVARRHALALREVAAMDNDGLAPDGTRVDLAPGGTRVVDTVFTTQPGPPTRLVEAEGANFFAVQVQAVMPPTLRPFETVAAEVRTAWENAERRRAMEAQAAQMLAAVQGGMAFEAAAAAQGWTARRIGPFHRGARGAGAPPPALLQAIFGLAPGAVTMVEANQAFIVVGIARVIAPDQTPERLDPLRAALANAIADDLEAQFAQAIQTRAGATINPRAIQIMVGTDP